MTKRLLIMAGGTGGHIFPGLAVADHLQAQGVEIHWLGTPKRMEAELVPGRGYPIHFIDIQGLRGKGLMGLLSAPLKLARALWQAREILARVKPDAVLGMGGFASGPGGLVARLAGIPLLVHEQNAVAGMTNRYLARLAQTVLCAFNGALPGAKVVGNPVREAFFAITAKAADDTPAPLNVLVTGGSLGAQVFNELMPQVAKAMGSKLNIRHQSGAGKHSQVAADYQAAGVEGVEVMPFIDDVAAAFAWADVIVCRAGALTVAEVAAAGRCAFFVPYPHAVDDHQYANARALTDDGAALMQRQHELTPETLIETLTTLYSQPDKRTAMAARAKSFANPNATKAIADHCLRDMGGRHD